MSKQCMTSSSKSSQIRSEICQWFLSKKKNEMWNILQEYNIFLSENFFLIKEISTVDLLFIRNSKKVSTMSFEKKFKKILSEICPTFLMIFFQTFCKGFSNALYFGLTLILTIIAGLRQFLINSTKILSDMSEDFLGEANCFLN